MKLTRPIYRLKRDARIAARTKDIPLHSALNRVAADEGFASWSLLAACHADMSPEAAFYQRLRAGNLALIGGRPGQGKTMMALKLAREALNGGNASMFFTLEYSLQGVADRLKQLDIPVGSERRFHVDCSNDICADYIAGKMRTARRGTLAVIDYLQILDQKREKPPAVALNIFSPLAATTRSPNVATIKTFSLAELVCGTTALTYLLNPFILLYPPSMSGSKFCSSNASPGCIINVERFKTNPPWQLNAVGCTCDRSGILHYSWI